jgi:opacity protein-like surface antigen
MSLLKQALNRLAAAGAVVLGMAALSDAQAQNWDGNHQVRAGFYLQSGRMGYDVNDGTNQQALKHNSIGIGGTGGLEWIRSGMLSIGTEIDFSATTGHETLSTPMQAIKVGAQNFASLRGRLGFHLRPNFVVYGTAGFGALGTELDGIGAGLNKVANTNTGGVYGGGFEFHRGGTILFAEYLHGNFGSRTAVIGGTSYTYDADMNAVRLGVKFKLGHDWRDEVRSDRGHEPLK